MQVATATAVVATHVLAIAEPTIEPNDFMVIAYNEFGGTVQAPMLGTITPITLADGKNFMMALQPPDAAVTRILILIPKHAVELADPRAELDDAGARKVEGKSAATSIEIHYLGSQPAAEAGDPDVISISKVGDSLLPVTGATFDVLITLSEIPRKDGFKKDQIDVSNATAADPVAIEPIDEITGGNRT